MTNMLASFISAEQISVTPYTLLWALPLLLGISIVVKAVKPEHFSLKKVGIEAAKLFVGSTVIIILIAAILGAVLELIN